MVLHVQQMAWLNAVPKPNENTKRAKRAKERGETVKRLSRREQLKKDGVKNPPMPPNPAPIILAHFIEVGVNETGGMAAAPISWGEIAAWASETGTPASPWEKRLLRQMSIEYLSQGRKAESENAPPPWRGEVTQEERDAEADLLDDLLG
jgi:hypothetical protein